MSTQQMLEAAIKLFGTDDKVTILISQKRDEEIAIEQSKIYEDFRGNTDVR